MGDGQQIITSRHGQAAGGSPCVLGTVRGGRWGCSGSI